MITKISDNHTKALTIKELWEEEKKLLNTLPANDYKVFKYENARIGATGLISIDKKLSEIYFST